MTTLSLPISLLAMGMAWAALAWSSYTTNSSFLPKTPPAALIWVTASLAPSWEDLPSAAANPVSGAWKPILMLSAASAIPAIPASSPSARANTANFLIILPPC
jgi:hypothetical protein